MKALREWQTGTLDLSVALGTFCDKKNPTYLFGRWDFFVFICCYLLL